MSPLTPAQRDIVERLGENLCVTSGAGCGKTSVLVERYIHFLRQDLTLGLERLAAITFTENAAAEMRRRIRRACQDELEAARTAGHTRAADVWRDRYWDVDIAPIDTIHGFCGGLLRRHAIEAGVDPNFSLLDEAEAALLRQDVVAATVEQLLGADDADLLAVLEHHDLGPARDMLGDVLQEKRELLRRVAAPVMARGDDDVLRGLRQAVDEEIVRALRAWIEGTGTRAAVETLRRAKGKPEDKLEPIRTAALAALERLDRAPSAKVAFDAATSLGGRHPDQLRQRQVMAVQGGARRDQSLAPNHQGQSQGGPGEPGSVRRSDGARAPGAGAGVLRDGAEGYRRLRGGQGRAVGPRF